MPTAINTNVGSIWQRFPGQKVFVKQTWAEDWAQKPCLFCNSMAKRASPETSSAELVYDYGIARQYDAAGLDVYAPLELANWYVKVQVDQFDASGNAIAPLVWIGVVTDRGDARQGAAKDSQGKAKPTGKQSFIAYGLEIFLEREIVRQSTVEAQDSFNVIEVDVNRPLGFNEPAARSEDFLQANRSGQPGEKGAYVFAKELAGADEWSVRAIVEYLLAYRSPKNALGEVAIPFELDAANLGQLPDWNHPKISVRRESVKDLIDAAISRKRLTGYYLDVDETASPAKVKLYPFTFAQADVGIGTATIEANPNQVSLDFDSAFDVDQATLKRSVAAQFDQVAVRGGRKGACCTVSFKDNNLAIDWDAAIETEYETAASTQGDYPTAWAEKQQRNRLWRQADRYKRVYAWFAIPATWTGETGDGENGVIKQPAIVKDDAFDQLDTFWPPGFLLQPYLPLLTDHDYTGDKIGAGTVVDKTPSGRQPERLRPLAFLKLVSNDGTTRYHHLEKPVESDKSDKYSLGSAQWHGSLRMQDRALGIELRTHGAPQHVIAKTDFSPADGSDKTPVADYRDNLIATVYLLTDHYLEVKHPETVAGNPDVVRLLEIDFGEEGRLDYVAPNTVVGVSDGKLQRSNGGYVRDDRDRMRQLAEAAYEWYREERQAFTLTYRQVSGAFKLGQLITQIGSGDTLEAVNTPITSIEWDLLAGTTTISTGFAELDVLQFSGTAPAGSIAGAGGGF